ncbi:MAG: nuclear transport factor 2 family protein [Solirubrobacterales bacterium]|nr:nuclear transport factor 2 family protein [Solirubrobacterales bacterium]
MAQENVETVRRAYEDGWFDKEPQQLLARMHADAEYVNPVEAVESGSRRGVAEVAEAFRGMQEAFDESRHELRRLYGTGDVVVADVVFVARGGVSKIDLVQDEAHTWTFREGKIARFEWGRNLAAALEAAGLGR